MKRYGNLYQQICTTENIALAHKKAQKGKRHYTEVVMVNGDTEHFIEEIRDMLVNKTFINSKYEVMVRMEGVKERVIWKLPYYPDRIIHHAIFNILEPIWMRTYIRDTYAALPGRGIHDGVRRVKKALASDSGTAYCLKMDVRKFYQSVAHAVLKKIIRKKIKCRDTLWLLDTIIDSAPGIPIGNFSSQHFGNLMMTELDHWIKERLDVKHYFRYCDDMVLLSDNKQQLHRWRRDIEHYLNVDLNLTLKDNWQVFPVAVRGIDFLGYRFFPNYTLIRKSIVSTFKHKYKYGSVRALAAYNGWFKWANTHNLANKYNWRKRYERF